MILNHRTTGNQFSNIKHAIKGLSQKQREALDGIAIGEDTCVSTEIGEALMRSGLVARYQDISPGESQVTVIRYRVPTNVHAVWRTVRTEEIRAAT